MATARVTTATSIASNVASPGKERKMFTRLTSILMIGALALTTVTVTPAMARDRSDNRNLIAGLALGAIVGAVIASNTKSRNRGHGGHVSQGYVGNPYGHSRGIGGGHNYARPAALPGACRVYAGNRSGYSGRCLSRSYHAYHALPSACAVHVGGHHRTIYRDRCLNQYGYY